MILRALFLDGSCRYKDFDSRSRGFSKNSVAKRLKALVDDGFVEMVAYENHPPRYSYRATKRSRKFGPIIKAMYSWGNAETKDQNR